MENGRAAWWWEKDIVVDRITGMLKMKDLMFPVEAFLWLLIHRKVQQTFNKVCQAWWNTQKIIGS